MMVLLPAQRQSSRQEWYIPRVPASWEVKAETHQSPGVCGQFGNCGETLSLKIDDKNQSLAFKKGVWYFSGSSKAVKRLGSLI